MAVGHRKCQLMTSGSPTRILIADDSPHMRRHLRRMLESSLKGAVVDEAEDGREAVEKVIQRSPDIVVMDVAMPVMNGLLATERISAIAPETPIVVHTMYATSQIEDELKKRGARAMVSKDDGQALLSTIERLSEEEIGSNSPCWL